MIFFWCFIGFVILQRLIELVIARRNEANMKAKGAEELDEKGYKFVVLMHVFFFLSLIAEKLFLQPAANALFYPFILFFLMAQALRYWSIISLGGFWNTKILILKGSKLIRKGPYKFISHPNYAAVITEIAVIPLIFSCYITAAAFSVLNIFVLIRRIRIESDALRTLESN